MSMCSLWQKKAETALKVARVAALDPETIENAAFWCHECASNALNAFMASRRQELTRFETLELHLEACIKLEPRFQALASLCKDLSPYVHTQYPSDTYVFNIDQAEITAAIEKAAKVLAFVKEVIAEQQQSNAICKG